MAEILNRTAIVNPVKSDSPVEAAARKVKVGIKNSLGLKGTKRVQILRGPARGIAIAGQ